MQNLMLQKNRVDSWMRENGARFAVTRKGVRQEMAAPYDPIPRILPAGDFTHIEHGLIQRVNALNLFLNDIYHSRMILRDGVIPEEFVFSSPAFLPQCMHITPVKMLYSHITATDLVQATDGVWYVMDDRPSAPEGITYPYFARKLCRTVAPSQYHVPTLCDNCGLDILLRQLYRDVLDGMSEMDEGLVLLLAEGRPSYSDFELRSLADLTGSVLARPDDLVVMDGGVYYRQPHVGGFKKVAILHRLTPDTALDPLCFDSDSLSGVPHLMEAYAEGRVAILNAPGCGVAEDRGLFYFIPAMIRYYLDEEPILPNVPTYLPWDEDQRSFILDHLPQLVIKDISGLSPAGTLYGDSLTEGGAATIRQMLTQNPRRYIAQAYIQVSQLETLAPDGGREMARCDFRAYTVHCDSIRVWMGGLSRYTTRDAAGEPLSGFKDTWVMSE